MPGIQEVSASKRIYAEGAAPATPASGTVIVYAKTDGLIYAKDDAGVETLLGGVTALAASAVTVADAGGLYTAVEVEAALAEVMTALDVEEAANVAHAADADAHIHATAHSDGGTDEVNVENLAATSITTTEVLAPDGSGGVEFRAPAAAPTEYGGIGVSFDTPAASDQFDIEVPFDCTIVAAVLLADASGSIVIDVWKDSYANFPPTDADTITSATPPTITTATKSEDTTLTGWTTSLTKGDILRFNVDSVTTITRVTLMLRVTK